MGWRWDGGGLPPHRSLPLTAAPGGSNYHIFYQLFSASARARFGLGIPEDYHYLRQSGCVAVQGIDDDADFREVMRAMEGAPWGRGGWAGGRGGRVVG